MRELFRITALVLGLSLISPFWTEATPVVDQIFAPTVPDIRAWLNTGGLDFP